MASTLKDTNATSIYNTINSNNFLNTERSEIAEFFNGRSVFITGGTGFMGKALVEKLLRSCSGIKNIYLLVRPKRGHEIAERMVELLNGPLFDAIRKYSPQDLDKVIPIHGDITSDELGISESDQELLCRTVSVVFHSAATVKFDEKLKLSVQINMIGTKWLVDLCHRMVSLEALVHVSTAYCNCDKSSDIDEVIYSPPFSPEDIISLVNWLPEDLIDKLTPALIGARPNTYTFTKALTESMLLHEARNLPVCIVRPSIVLSSINEPVAGWVDNWNGPTGLISALGKGIFRTMILDENVRVDLIPVDIVINLMVAVAWKTGTSKDYEIAVYNCCSGQQKPITWGAFVDLCLKNMIHNPIEGTLWYPSATPRLNKLATFIHSGLTHYIPAYIMDLIARSAGRRPIMVRVQDKLNKAAECLEYFTTHEWKFRNDNVQNLLELMSPKDRQEFRFDVSEIDWENYVEAYVLGFRKFLFKQSPASIIKERKNMQRLYYIHQISKFICVLLLWRFLLAHSKTLKTIWENCLKMLMKFLRIIPFM